MNGHAERLERDPPALVPLRTLTGLRVFIAEDEPILLLALEDVLTDLGCVVVGTAARVKDSLAFVADNVFDLAVLDGALSDGNIDPVVEILMARRTPIVIASGFSSPSFSATFKAAVFIRKPYTDAMLHQAVIRALNIWADIVDVRGPYRINWALSSPVVILMPDVTSSVIPTLASAIIPPIPFTAGPGRTT
jgi:CheY-like chemotaxis protein